MIKTCQEPDRDVPALKCGAPLPCPYHVTPNHAQKRAASRDEHGRRPFINEETSNIGVGALSLDVASMRGGERWTDVEIEQCWTALSAVYKAFSRPIMLRNGHQYLVDNIELHDPIYIGPTKDGPALSAKSVRSLRKQGMRTIEEVLAGKVRLMDRGWGLEDIAQGRTVGKSDRRAGERRAKARRVSDRSRLATGKRHKR